MIFFYLIEKFCKQSKFFSTYRTFGNFRALIYTILTKTVTTIKSNWVLKTIITNTTICYFFDALYLLNHLILLLISTNKYHNKI